jgi:hypothetical protein
MSDHDEPDIGASKARRHNAKHEPDVYGFEGETIDALYSALGEAIENGHASLLVHLGRDEDCHAEAILQVKSEGEEVGHYNVSYTCPPRPEDDCAH